MPQNSNTIRVSLSELDERGPNVTSRINMGYVVQTIDVDALQNAVDRVVDRWRLLAGKLDLSEEWCLHVPLGAIPGPKFKFTHRTLPASSSTPLLHLNATSTEVLVRPSLEHFCDPATPNSHSKYASTKAPLLSVHVTQLVDCVCIGFSLPHCVFDAFGMGQVMHAIDAELNGREWTPPPLVSTNPLRECLSELVDSEADTIDKEETQAMRLARETIAPAGVWSVLAMLVSLAFEYVWHGARVTKVVYLGEDSVKRIVDPAKTSASSDGGWVSTGDILALWLIKTAYLDEVGSKKILVAPAVSARKTLEAKDKVLAEYTHNNLLPATLKLDLDSLPHHPVSYFANLHRKTIEGVRTLGFIQSYRRWLFSFSAPLVLVRKPGVDSWLFSSQVIGRMDKIYFGSPTYAFWHWNTPVSPDHSVIMNKFNGGYLLQGRFRKSRWEAIEREVERIKVGTPRVV